MPNVQLFSSSGFREVPELSFTTAVSQENEIRSSQDVFHVCIKPVRLTIEYIIC